MNKILKINNFTEESGSRYGLDTGGTCYIVKKPFHAELNVFYNREPYGKGIKLTPSWAKIKLENGDMISVTDDECYVELKGFNGFLQCRPDGLLDKKDAKLEEPNFISFPIENLERIGKNILKCKPMAFDDRKNVSVVRV
jgi:hypothetical protein